MEGPNGRSFVTKQYAVLAHGKAEREFPFVACSDSAITEVCFIFLPANPLSNTVAGGIQSLSSNYGS